MTFSNPGAEVFVPDGTPAEAALRRTTVMGIGAHQDDLEFGAYAGILKCLREPGQWFTGVTCTDGAGCARTGRFASYSNEQMMEVRWQEQRNAALLGRYAAVIQLKHTSSATKDAKNPAVVSDLKAVFALASPSIVFTHNPADKHDTHVAVMLRVLEALRSLPADRRPSKFYGMELWRGLDWLPDEDKVVMDITGDEHMAATLLSAYDSQIAGGKRYDLATLGRWRANATYLASHAVDTAQVASYLMDLTPLIRDIKLDVVDYTAALVDKLRSDVSNRVGKHNT